MQPTYFFEVGKRYPFPKGEIITDIIHVEKDDKNSFLIYNQDGLLGMMISKRPIVFKMGNTTIPTNSDQWIVGQMIHIIFSLNNESLSKNGDGWIK